MKLDSLTLYDITPEPHTGEPDVFGPDDIGIVPIDDGPLNLEDRPF